MPEFTDKKGQSWSVDLDPVIADEIRTDHGIDLTNLERDPMLQLRSNPAILCAAMLVICRDQWQERNLTREQFLKLLPFPPDPMLGAIEAAVVNFFPTGRASHVREVLAGFADMAAKTDELTIAKMSRVKNDPRTMQAMSDKADQAIDQALETLIGSQPGTSSTEAAIASS